MDKLNASDICDSVTGIKYNDWRSELWLHTPGVRKIVYFPARGDGDSHKCQIIHEDGSETLIFNPDEIHA